MSKRARALAVLGAVIAIAAAAASARADEGFRQITTTVALSAEGAQVRHHIVVEAEGRDIEHGIFLDPPHAIGPLSNIVVLRDGVEDGVRWDDGELRIGRGNVKLAPGTYVYDVSYDAAAPFVRLKDGGERFSWTPFAPDSDLAWDKIDVAISWSGADPVRVFGPAESQAGAYAWSLQRGDDVERVELEWAPGAWPADLVRTPSVNDTLRYGAPLGVLLVLAACHIMWMRLGRDAPAGRITPSLKPPAGLSAAAARYVERMSYDVRAFAAALASLVVKGAVVIAPDGKHAMNLTRATPRDTLSAGETRVLEALMDGGHETRIKAGDARVTKAQVAHARSLRAEHQARLWIENRGVWAGLFALALAVAATAIVSAIVEAQLFDDDKFAVLAGVFSGIAAFTIPLFYFAAMRAPTSAGRKAMDEIEGLKRALSDGAPLSPSEAKPERFVALLPHAVALDVEEAWAARFGADLRDTAAGPARTVIDWYQDALERQQSATFVAAILPAIAASSSTSAATSAGASAGGW